MLYHTKLNKKLRYRQRILDDLRSGLRSEYLGSLLLKDGKKETRELKLGEVVLIGDDAYKKRLDWPLALVVDAFTGRDGKSRVYMLKTKNSILKPPLQRLYPLEVSIKNSDLTRDLRQKAKRYSKRL